jgi:multiple sugar transport system substrate-binding protein
MNNPSKILLKMLRLIFSAMVVFELMLACGDVRAQELQVGYLITAGQRPAFENIFDRFTLETGIKVIGIPRKDEGFRHDLPIWLLQGRETPDVVYWQASQRLYFYAARDALHPITELWKDENLDKNFSQVKTGVIFKGEIYALPLHYYSWGLYFKKSVVEQFGGVPGNWEDFISLCSRIKQAGITPLGLGAKDRWPVAGWFDYIDLRLNGLDFHLKLLNGEISFTDSRVQRVFLEWKRLIDLKFFNPDSARVDWDDVFPYMYRNEIAFTLAGNFVSSKLPNAMATSIGFMPFPKMSNIDDYEEAPMNVLIIPKSAKHIQNAERFIKFMARADVQSDLAAALGYLPANRAGTVGQGAFIRAGSDMLHKAAGISQYFDRDTVPAFEQKALPILVDFLKIGDIKKTTDMLEKVRKDSFRE